MGHLPAASALPDGTAAALYQWLLDRQTCRNVFDAHVFACVLSRRLPMGIDALGLTAQSLNRLVARYFPAALADGLPWIGPTRDPAPLPSLLRAEVADLTGLLLNHRGLGTEEEEWLAAILARACLDTEPLWAALGLAGRNDLNALMRRHFRGLAGRNDGSQGWRPFLYRLLCLNEGLIPCASDQCHDCGAGSACFGWVEW